MHQAGIPVGGEPYVDERVGQANPGLLLATPINLRLI